MQNTVLLFESRDLCYESNRYFVECIAEALEQRGYIAEICDLSVQMEEKLERILDCQKKYLLAVDFNSLLPRLELEDGTPYLKLFSVPFFNYLVDHPLYHHAGLKKGFPLYFVLCIDTLHRAYIERYYPHIKKAYDLPLGAMRAKLERNFSQKRMELLFLGTYEPEEKLYQELWDYPKEARRELTALIEMMKAESELTQEKALKRYLTEQGQTLEREEFAKRLNQDYLADKYLRNVRRKEAVLAAAKANVPFTIIGHGWDAVRGLDKQQIQWRQGVGFAASIQMMANARMLLNSTPGFHGGLHDRVYSAMINHTLCFTERSRFAQTKLTDGEEVIFYDDKNPDALTEKIVFLHQHPSHIKEIAEKAFAKAAFQETWDARVKTLLDIALNTIKEA